MSPAAPTVQADSLPLSYGGRGEAGKEPFIPYKKANAILFFHNLFGGESFFFNNNNDDSLYLYSV